MPAARFDTLRTAARLLGEVVAELDGDVLDVEGAKVLVDVFTRCERLAVAGRGVAARRVATAVNWKHAGHRNPAEWFASATGVGVGEASRELETAQRLEELPATAGAFRAGELSEAQASEIAASASVDPDAEANLLSLARDGATFRNVRDRCRELALRASDDAAQARRLHETRTARTYPGHTGHLVLHAEIPVRLRRWVEEAYPACGRVGCDNAFRLEIDHIEPLAAGGRTEKANLWRLCGHDHHLKTYRGWRAIDRSDGTRDLVPPDAHLLAADDPDPPEQR